MPRRTRHKAPRPGSLKEASGGIQIIPIGTLLLPGITGRTGPELSKKTVHEVPEVAVSRAERGRVRVRCSAMGEDTTGPYGTSSGKESGQRVSVDEAARLLGVTVDAIRKRVQRQTIPHQRDESGRVWVLLDAARTMQDKSSNVQDSDVQDGTGPGGREILEAKDETIEALREQVAYLQGVISTRDRELALRADEIRRRDSALEREQELAAMFADRLRQLEPGSPRDEPHDPETVSETTEGTETPSDRLQAETGVQRPERRPSWWRRFFGFE